jgi:hypothetical protein
MASPRTRRHRSQGRGRALASGPWYGTWAGLTALHPDAIVARASLLLDSGHAGDQRGDASYDTVNDNTWVPETSQGVDTTTPGAFAKTCDLPVGTVQVCKADSTPTAVLNETRNSVRLEDAGPATARCSAITSTTWTCPASAGNRQPRPSPTSADRTWPTRRCSTCADTIRQAGSGAGAAGRALDGLPELAHRCAVHTRISASLAVCRLARSQR